MKQHCVSCLAMHLVQANVLCMLYHFVCVFMDVIDQRTTSAICSVCCSSLLLQQLKPVLCVVRSAVSSINSLAVICEKHQVLPNKKM